MGLLSRSCRHSACNRNTGWTSSGGNNSLVRQQQEGKKGEAEEQAVKPNRLMHDGKGKGMGKSS